MNRINKAHLSLQRPQPLSRENDLSEKEVQSFLFWLACYVIALIVFTAFIIYEASAQTTDDAVFLAGPSTESEQVQLIEIIETIEKPSMDLDIIPEPAIIDFNAPNYLEMVYYRMTIALQARALREGKAPDYYVSIFKAQWESEKPKSVGEALRAVKVVEPKCPDGFEIYEESGICNQFPSHVSAEQNYYHCSLNNYQLWLENTELKAELEQIKIPNFADGANKGNLWKPIADPVASCSGGTTVLLDKKYDAPSITLQILDPQLVVLNEFIKRLPNLNDGRPRFCVSKAGADFRVMPIYIKFLGLTFRVNNPANRED